jgi:hypothetical protein
LNWSLGDGSYNTTAPGLVHSYAPNATYWVKVTLTDALGESVEQTLQLNLSSGNDSAHAPGLFPGDRRIDDRSSPTAAPSGMSRRESPG